MSACSQEKEKVDCIFFNAKIYTVDKQFTIAECFAVDDGKFIAIGNTVDIKSKYDADTLVDLNGKFVYPGFIDAHCHFVGYAKNLNVVDLTDAKSFDELLDRIHDYYNNHTCNWLIGRGWDQNLWNEKIFPTKEKLDELFPNIPVVMTRIDGHAAIVNSVVLKLANINADTKIEGGEIILKNGQPTGVLIDNAMTLYEKLIPTPTNNELSDLLMTAQRNCFQVGLTGVGDAGLDLETIHFIDSLQTSGKLEMRISAMLNFDPHSIDFINSGQKIKTNFLHVNSIKLYADGALGSRGACLLEPYSDQPEHFGLITLSSDSMKKICELAFSKNYQVCVHAIGDSANRMVLNVFSSVLKEKNNRRWRIEHCQVINENDFSMFGDYSIIPSVQPTHATSDMYWAEDRLGKNRIKNAYAYNLLLKQNNWIPFGSDFPIESINPILGFYAAVSRKDRNGFPENGFQIENALSRQEALMGMTIWAAKASFEENEKGSIETGKFADFVVLEKDIMQCQPSEIYSTKVIGTYIAGKQLYSITDCNN